MPRLFSYLFVMALIKLGAFFTNIAGSVGGTTFRRSQHGIVLSNKIVGIRKSVLFRNTRLSELRSVIQGWALLSQVNRDSWNEIAHTFSFPDKFGDLRTLSGRLLYIKLNASLLIVGNYYLNASSINSIVHALEVGNIQFLLTGDLSIPINHAPDSGFALAQVVPFSQGGILPSVSGYKFNGWIDFANDDTIIIPLNEMSGKAHFAVGGYVRVFITSMNVHGFRSVPQIFDVFITW